MSKDGALAYRPLDSGRTELVSFDRSGSRIASFGNQPGSPQGVRFSPGPGRPQRVAYVSVFRAGKPHVLFKASAPLNGVANDQGFAVSPDGKTVVLAVPPRDASPTGIHIIVNWQSELAK